MKKWLLFGIQLLLLFIYPVNGQIKINEFLAANSGLNPDPDYSGYSDWLELYNSGNQIVNLKGYYLTDNLSIPAKWMIQENVSLNPGELIVIWADGNNTGLHAGFKLAAEGEQIGLFDPRQVLVDSITFGLQFTNISSGRETDGNGKWGVYDNPTPGVSNSLSVFYEDIAKNAPVFSVSGGIYTSPQTIQLTTLLGGQIRYTLDGSEPILTSALYSGPIPITKNAVIRARIFKPGMIPGPVVTHSYFLEGDLQLRGLPVVSVVSNPENFWDPVKGIYVQDFKPLWEIPLNIELFENNGSDRAAFNEKAGGKINGLYSWQLPQKMLGIYFRGKYGSGQLEYPLMFHKERASYKTFALRASGSDWSYTLFRDKLGQDASRLNTQLDFMDFRPSVVFFNGEYMGIHNIREKVDDDFIEKNHNLVPGTYDLIENEDFAEAGDLAAYEYLQGFLSQDLSLDSNYELVAELIDVENFTDLVVLEMATGNTSIDHNVMAWKPKTGGKWKWVIMDLDRGFFNPGSNLIGFYLQQNSFPFRELMENEGYRTYFGKRLADQLFTSYHPLRMKELVDEHASIIRNEVPYHVDRWQGATSSYGDAIPSSEYWEKEVYRIKLYAEERPSVLLKDLNRYGFNGTSELYVSCKPEGAGNLEINGLMIPGQPWAGPYPNQTGFTLSVKDNPGYDFTGWQKLEKQELITRNSTWKYLDDGSSLHESWKTMSFNDENWKTGKGTLGYGNGDTTQLDYGGVSNDKYISYFFRKTFELNSDDLANEGYILSLLRDDGAVVYLNGSEILRSNMPEGEIDYTTLAFTGVSGSSESNYYNYLIDSDLFISGLNLIAVEVHQESRTSGDISFDLKLSVLKPGETLSEPGDRDIQQSLENDSYFLAVYESDGSCLIPDTIRSDMRLDKECSPWVAQGDVTVLAGVTLSIDPGTEIHMPPRACLTVHGKLDAIGSASERILFRADPESGDEPWGAILFDTPADSSVMQYVTIENASEGKNPARDYAAISVFKGKVLLDHIRIDHIHSNPIIARYSDIILTNSYLHSEVTGDLINVKYGKARIENCEFRGSNSIDADAIDYDGIENGLIRNCRIYDCLGINSDAVDVGENTTNLLIDSIIAINIRDKGVSVGQLSTVHIRNSVFVNCNLGLGLKDLSHTLADHCTFYGNTTAIACYEKNPGSAGGIASVTNSILSNSSSLSYSSDSQSELTIRYSISDNTPLPELPGNLFGNPLFVKPDLFDFTLQSGSPAIQSGSDLGIKSDMGADLSFPSVAPFPLISYIFTDPHRTGEPEFIGILNPSEKLIDLSGFSISKGFTFQFPDGTYLESGKTIFITSDAGSESWSHTTSTILEWNDGGLANTGEEIELIHENGLVIDYLEYSDKGEWPAEAFMYGKVIRLKSPGSDNHFGENWEAYDTGKFFSSAKSAGSGGFTVFPNPTRGNVDIVFKDEFTGTVQVFSSLGQLLGQYPSKGYGIQRIDLSVFGEKILFIKAGTSVIKVILLQ